METTSPKPQLAPEQILRACDCVELVWQEQGSEAEKAKLEEFHADGPELARLIGESGALLPGDYLTAVPDEHAGCESAYALRHLATWRAGTSSGGASRAAARTPHGSRRDSWSNACRRSTRSTSSSPTSAATPAPGTRQLRPESAWGVARTRNAVDHRGCRTPGLPPRSRSSVPASPLVRRRVPHIPVTQFGGGPIRSVRKERSRILMRISRPGLSRPFTTRRSWTHSAQPELVRQGRIHLGDEPGVYGDASYSGLAVDIPLTLQKTDPTGPDTTALPATGVWRCSDPTAAAVFCTALVRARSSSVSGFGRPQLPLVP